MLIRMIQIVSVAAFGIGYLLFLFGTVKEGFNEQKNNGLAVPMSYWDRCGAVGSISLIIFLATCFIK